MKLMEYQGIPKIFIGKSMEFSDLVSVQWGQIEIKNNKCEAFLFLILLIPKPICI